MSLSEQARGGRLGGRDWPGQRLAEVTVCGLSQPLAVRIANNLEALDGDTGIPSE